MPRGKSSAEEIKRNQIQIRDKITEREENKTFGHRDNLPENQRVCNVSDD